MVALAVLVAVTALLACAAVFVASRQEKALRARMRSDVIVTLKSGDSFSGVMFDRDALTVVLRNAVDLRPQAPVPVDGELLIRWAEVAYVQLP
jgi:small nuclear ribonucleoprotein (snRNP)-like protein